ncbi:MAG: histone deacetylase [Verrucomicrobiota bacterium]
MKVFYDPRQNAAKNDSFSPSASKPALVVQAWQEAGIHLDIESFEPLSVEDISLAHDEQHVRDILDGRKQNGFYNTLLEVAVSLPWTTGSFAAAAKYAYQTRRNACSPTSGFHHACHSQCGGFCTFNGLVIAARILTDRFKATRIGILDCDRHYGNGTDNIIAALKLQNIAHHTFGQHIHRVEDAKDWLAELCDLMRNNFQGCTVLFYQAGADPHVNDPLGGLLTTEELRIRDAIVFETAREMKIPVCWNLAGGYQEPISKVLEIHTNTAREAEKME